MSHREIGIVLRYDFVEARHRLIVSRGYHGDQYISVTPRSNGYDEGWPKFPDAQISLRKSD